MKKNEISINKSQEIVDKFILKFCGGYWNPLCNLLRLVEEVGELSREINHKYGSKTKKNTEPYRNIKEEIGDIFFSVICIANFEKINLEESLNEVLKKYKDRDKNRWK